MDLKKADDTLLKIAKKLLKFKYINPTNQEKEKESFFSQKNYNPQFKNIRKNKNLREYELQLKEIQESLKNPKLEKIFKDKAKKLIIWIKMLENTGKEDFTKYSSQYYGIPSKELVEKAKKLVKIEAEQKKKTISSKEMAKILNKEIKKYDGWKSEEKSNLGSRIDASTLEKTLYVKQGEKFTKEDVKRLIIHEIKTHVQRCYNGEKQKYKIFSYGTADYEKTEEGLAVYMEEKNKVIEKSTMKNYAGRVLAIHLALEKSFRETFNGLCNYFTSKDAYHLTLRAKRGLSDTSKPGAFTKDIIYLEGYERVKEYLKKNPKNINLLFKGKIDIKDLILLKASIYH